MSLDRFLKAHQDKYSQALLEIKKGRKNLTGFGSYSLRLKVLEKVTLLNIMV